MDEPSACVPCTFEVRRELSQVLLKLGYFEYTIYYRTASTAKCVPCIVTCIHRRPEWICAARGYAGGCRGSLGSEVQMHSLYASAVSTQRRRLGRFPQANDKCPSRRGE